MNELKHAHVLVSIDIFDVFVCGGYRVCTHVSISSSDGE